MDTIYEKVGKMVNAVRLASDDYYQSIVPIFVAHDSDNPDPEFKQFGNIITDNALIMNKFLKGFQDVILYEAFQIHAFENEFSRRFKKESNPLRRATFETFVNPVNPLQYDGEALDRILKLYPRDVKRVTYIRNREDIFPVSFNREEAVSAFQSMEAFYDFYTRQYVNLQNSNAIVEYNDIKQCFNANYASGALKVINIHGKTPKEISTLLREIITRMTKPSSDFNNYINLEGATGEPVITNTPKESIVFMPDAQLLASQDTEVLAGAYNMAFAEVTKNILPVDDWGYNVYDRENQKILRKESSKIKAVLCDEYTLKFDEGLDQNLSGFNIASLTNQTFYHVWQTIALRPFCNCVVLVDDGEEPSEDFEIVIPENGITFTDGVATLEYNGNIPDGVTENSFLSIGGIGGTVDGINLLPFNVTINEELKTITLQVRDVSYEINGSYSSTIDSALIAFGNLVDEQYVTIWNSKILSNLALTNIPVGYTPKITNFEVNIPDVTQDGTITLSVVPTDVTPEATLDEETITLTAINISTDESFRGDYVADANNSITISADTFTNGTYDIIIGYNNILIRKDVVIGS